MDHTYAGLRGPNPSCRVLANSACGHTSVCPSLTHLKHKMVRITATTSGFKSLRTAADRTTGYLFIEAECVPNRACRGSLSSWCTIPGRGQDPATPHSCTAAGWQERVQESTAKFTLDISMLKAFFRRAGERGVPCTCQFAFCLPKHSLPAWWNTNCKFKTCFCFPAFQVTFLITCWPGKILWEGTGRKREFNYYTIHTTTCTTIL